jgi:hypothetical protein
VAEGRIRRFARRAFSPLANVALENHTDLIASAPELSKLAIRNEV